MEPDSFGNRIENIFFILTRKFSCTFRCASGRSGRPRHRRPFLLVKGFALHPRGTGNLPDKPKFTFSHPYPIPNNPFNILPHRSAKVIFSTVSLARTATSPKGFPLQV